MASECVGTTVPRLKARLPILDEKCKVLKSDLNRFAPPNLHRQQLGFTKVFV